MSLLNILQPLNQEAYRHVRFEDSSSASFNFLQSIRHHIDKSVKRKYLQSPTRRIRNSQIQFLAWVAFCGYSLDDWCWWLRNYLPISLALQSWFLKPPVVCTSYRRHHCGPDLAILILSQRFKSVVSSAASKLINISNFVWELLNTIFTSICVSARYKVPHIWSPSESL